MSGGKSPNTIEKDILSWSRSLPIWQRNVFRRIVLGEVLEDSYINQLVYDMVSGNLELDTPELEETDFPVGSSANDTTALCSVDSLHNVNALLDDQSLSFAENGITVIYGDNGSGKSGYARLLKDIVGARHPDRILPNVYTIQSDQQHAEVTYSVNGVAASTEWPGSSDSSLLRIHFYDEECGDDYLEQSTELTYRPSVLAFLEQFIAVIDTIRDKVQELITKNADRTFITPQVDVGTSAENLLKGLSAQTTQQAIDEATSLPENSEQKLADLITKEARLNATDPTKEKQRLLLGADSVVKLANHLDEIYAALESEATQNLLDLKGKSDNLRRAAIDASKTSFTNEPLQGVGSESWRLMWEAAERYSTAEAYPDANFPATGPADYCVLCQQPIGSDAKDRFERFYKFIHNDLETKAKTAEKMYAEAFSKISQLEISTTDTTTAITFLMSEDKTRGEAISGALSHAKNAQELIIKQLNGQSSDPCPNLIDVDRKDLRTIAADYKTRGDAIEVQSFRDEVASTSKEKNELNSRMILAKQKEQIEDEVVRLKEEANLKSLLGKITTTAITRKSTELSRKYVTATVKSYFEREAKDLMIHHVVLGDKGGLKGKIQHQPTLTGASDSSPKLVLSEGEQTAVGLAGFFTEVFFDTTKSAVVFDDPISSLDHVRRAKVADRIAEFARDRQVIVFTHDLVFLGDLYQAAYRDSVALSERYIEKDCFKQPGFIKNEYPWKAKSVNERVQELDIQLASLKANNTDEHHMDPEQYEDEVAKWAGKLSETWERSIRADILSRISEPGTPQVHPAMLKLLARITEQDNIDFQTGYSKTSTWARRHDKSPEENYVAPQISDLETELNRIKSWRKHLKQYQN